MRVVALLLITLGTIGAAIGVARTDPAAENWVRSFQWHVPLTGASLLVLGGGIFALRRASRAARAAQASRGLLESAREALRSVHDQADRLGAEAAQLDLDALHARLDAIQSGPMTDFVENRNAITDAHGLGAYAAVMGPFAQGERYLNRAWSASTDGYKDEAVDYLRRAQPHLAEASTLLEQLGRPPAG